MSGLENIYCEAKKHLHIAGPPLNCGICRWKNECPVYHKLERIQHLMLSVEQKELKFVESCKETKLEVCDFDAKESWLVITIDPEAYRRFPNLLDDFLLELKHLKKATGYESSNS